MFSFWLEDMVQINRQAILNNPSRCFELLIAELNKQSQVLNEQAVLIKALEQRVRILEKSCKITERFITPALEELSTDKTSLTDMLETFHQENL